MDNNEALGIVKSALESNDLVAGGYLNAMQSERFIRGVLDQPTILKSCRSILINGDSAKIEKIGFGSRIMRPAQENTALSSSDYAKPTFGKVDLLTKEAIAEVRISYDTLENNIEGQNLKNTIISMIQQRVALDLEELAINGDKNSDDTYLKLVDGWLVKANQHVINANGAPISSNLYRKLIGAVPDKYKRVPTEWRIFNSFDMDLDYKEQIAQRSTAAGDKFLLDKVNASAFGFQIQPCAMMPVDSTTKLSKALLTHPQNLIAGFTRKVSIETDKDISARQIIIVVTMKVDFAIEEADATAVLTNVLVNTDPSSSSVDLEGTKGVYYYEVTDAFTADDTIEVYGQTYTCKAAEDVENRQFAGATIAAQVTSLAKMVTYGGFTISADDDRLVFTQKVPLTGFTPTLVTIGAGNTTGAIGTLKTITTAKTADPIT